MVTHGTGPGSAISRLVQIWLNVQCSAFKFKAYSSKDLGADFFTLVLERKKYQI